jgi:signal transduction histidine kinase
MAVERITRASLGILLIVLGALALTGAFVWLRLTGASDGTQLGPAAWRPHGVVVTALYEAGTGLRQGDLIVAVDGRSLELWAQGMWVPERPRPHWLVGQTVIYTVERDGQRRDISVVLGRYPLGRVLMDNWGQIILAIVFLIVSAFIYVRRFNDAGPRALLLTAVGMLAGVPLFHPQVLNLIEGTGFWLFQALFLGVFPLVLSGFLHFALVFPRPQALIVRFPWVILLGYAGPYLAHALFALAVQRDAPGALAWIGRSAADHTVLIVVYLVLIMAAIATGYRSARDPVSRQQVRWVVYAVLAAGACSLAFGLLPEVVLGRALLDLNGQSLLSLIVPLAIAIAILRYHLFDIDLIINRTLVYGALTTAVVGLYVLMVGTLGVLFNASGNLIIALLATGLVAALFQPLRARLQRAIDRLMYGEREDPYAILARLGQRLEATLAPDTVLPTIVETVAQALKLPYVAIALAQSFEFRVPSGRLSSELETLGTQNSKLRTQNFQIVASYGQPSGELFRLPLVYQAEPIGTLVLSPRAPGEALAAADQRLLVDLARQIAVAVHAVRLTADVQRSRERLVTAREEERRRLRRELHDGLGPTLASLTLKLDVAQTLVFDDLPSGVALLAQLQAQTKTAIDTVRRLTHELRPPALDQLGLASALREQVAQYTQVNGLAVLVDIPEELPPLPAAVEVAAYHIAVEALINVVRHAHAHTCRIRLMVDTAVCVEISDDGRGLPAACRAGVGLQSMRERAAELGGTCTVAPIATGGTCVRARLPL